MRPYDEDPHDPELFKSRTTLNRWDRLLPVPPDFFPGPGTPSSGLTTNVPLFNDMDKRRPLDNDDLPPLKL